MTFNLRNLYRLNAKKGSFKAEANTIWLYDMIVPDEMEAEWMGGVAPKPFIDALNAMTGPVHLRINSPGGDVFAANAMAQAMREYDGEIIAHIDGVAASAASVIAVVAPKCVMAPGSLMMMHKAYTLTIGNDDDHMETAALLKKVDGMLAQTYAAKSGKDAAHYAPMLAAETWFTPDEAVAEGLADEIAEAKPKNCVRWNLSAFAHAPKIAEPEAEVPPAEIIPDNSEIEARQRRHAARMLQPAV